MGLLNNCSQLNGKIIKMFQTTNQVNFGGCCNCTVYRYLWGERERHNYTSVLCLSHIRIYNTSIIIVYFVSCGPCLTHAAGVHSGMTWLIISLPKNGHFWCPPHFNLRQTRIILSWPSSLWLLYMVNDDGYYITIWLMMVNFWLHISTTTQWYPQWYWWTTRIVFGEATCPIKWEE